MSVLFCLRETLRLAIDALTRMTARNRCLVWFVAWQSRLIRAPGRTFAGRWWPRLARGEDAKLTLIHCENCNRVNELLSTRLGTGGSPEASMRSVFHLNV